MRTVTVPMGSNGLRDVAARLGGDMNAWSQSLSALLGIEVLVKDVNLPERSSVKAHGMTDTLVVSAILPGGLATRLYLKTPEEGLYAETLISDRTRELAWRLEGYPAIPDHVTCAGTAWITAQAELKPTGISLAGCCLVEWEAPGQGYHERLTRLGEETPGGYLSTVDAIADYLVALHEPVPGDQRRLYDRVLRDTLMNAVFRLIDGASERWDHQFDRRLAVEQLFVGWRCRLSRHSDRLRRTHNDFHPWNILLEGDRVRVIGARVPGMGDPAEDLAALLVNYVWFGYLCSGDFAGAYREAFDRLWLRYLRKTGDEGCAEVFAPFFAKRLLVLLNPVYYPDQPPWVISRLTDLLMRILRGEIDALRNPADLTVEGA